MPGACDRRATQRGGMHRRPEWRSYFRTGPKVRPMLVAHHPAWPYNHHAPPYLSAAVDERSSQVIDSRARPRPAGAVTPGTRSFLFESGDSSR